MEEYIFELLKEIGAEFKGTAKIWYALGLFLGWRIWVISKREQVQEWVMSRLDNKTKHLAQSDLFKNALFFSHGIYRNRIKQLRFGKDRVKTEVFQLIFEKKLNSDIEVCEKFLREKNFNKMTKSELIVSLLDVIEQITSSSDAAIMSALIEKHGKDKGRKLFEFVMAHEEGFIAKRLDRLNILLQVVNKNLQFSPVYHTNTERVDNFLFTVNQILHIAIFDAQKMFEGFNGEIRRIVETGSKEPT